MSQIVDISGNRFSRFLVLTRAGSNKNGHALWLCKCDCGTEKIALGNDLRSGRTKSCGCWNKESAAKHCRSMSTHGMHRTPEYRSWVEMRRRCRSRGRDNSGSYLDRGIKVCERWDDFVLFLSDMGQRPSLAHSIERKDNDKGYDPTNCVWGTPTEQANNKRNNRFVYYKGKTVTVAQARHMAGDIVIKATVLHRLKHGWPIERAVETPPDVRFANNKARAEDAA